MNLFFTDWANNIFDHRQILIDGIPEDEMDADMHAIFEKLYVDVLPYIGRVNAERLKIVETKAAAIENARILSELREQLIDVIIAVDQAKFTEISAKLFALNIK